MLSFLLDLMFLAPFAGLLVLALSVFIKPIRQNKPLMLTAKIVVLFFGLLFAVFWGTCYYIINVA